MEKSFADLLSDAFSETSVPLLDGDLEFESLDFDEDETILSHDEITGTGSQEEASTLSKTTSARSCDDKEVYDAKNNEETLQEVGVSVRPKWREGYTSSEEESGENEAESGEKPGDFLGTVHSSEDEEEVSAMGRPLTQKDNDETPVRNEEGEETEESYCGNIPGHCNSTRRDDCSDEEEDASKTIQYTLEYPESSYDNVQDLITDKYEMKIKDFSGEEHQEAGEGFAEYPSDFSSCEYVENTARVNESNVESQLNFTADSGSKDKMSGRQMESDESECLDLSMKANSTEKEEVVGVFLDKEVVKDHTDEDDSEESELNLSRKDELKMTKQDLCLEFPENQEDEPLQSWTTEEFPDWIVSEEDKTIISYKTDTDFNICWSLDTTLESEKAQMLTSDLHPAEDNGVKWCSEKQREEVQATVSSSHGSVDDSFFFNNEPEDSEVTEEGQLGDDEYEEERTWEQEQERIDAFNKFYNDRDGDSEREERKIKVQFSTEALSQVNYYDTDSDSSDSDSLSSSSDPDEDLDLDYANIYEEQKEQQEQQYLQEQEDSQEQEEQEDPQEQEEPEDVPQMDLWTCDSLNSPEITEKETESTNSQTCTRKHGRLSVLKMMLRIGLVVVMGLIVFWFVTDTADWPPFFL